MQGEIDHININSPCAIGGARDHRRARAYQGVDGDAPRGQGDILSPADPLVGAHAVDLEADTALGTCMIGPVRARSASSRRRLKAACPPGHEAGAEQPREAVTSPSASSVSVSCPRRTVAS